MVATGVTRVNRSCGVSIRALSRTRHPDEERITAGANLAFAIQFANHLRSASLKFLDPRFEMYRLVQGRRLQVFDAQGFCDVDVGRRVFHGQAVVLQGAATCGRSAVAVNETRDDPAVQNVWARAVIRLRPPVAYAAMAVYIRFNLKSVLVVRSAAETVTAPIVLHGPGIGCCVCHAYVSPWLHRRRIYGCGTHCSNLRFDLARRYTIGLLYKAIIGGTKSAYGSHPRSA